MMSTQWTADVDDMRRGQPLPPGDSRVLTGVEHHHHDSTALTFPDEGPTKFDKER